MTAWHVGDGLAGRYAAGTAAETDAWSLEKHVEACTPCAARVSAAVREQGDALPLLEGVRTAVLAAAAAGAEPVRARRRGRPWSPAPGPATRLGRVLWAAGPALRGAWTLALLLVALGAVALAYGGGLGGVTRPLLLVVAPVLPLAGVGVSYGRSADPMHEIVATTPGGGLRLLLIRTAAVLAVTVPVLTLAWAVLPGSAGGPGAVAWLLPGLAMTLAALALSSFVGCRAGAWSVAVCWAAAVAVPAAGTSPSPVADAAQSAARYFAGPAAQSGWAAAAALCAGLLALRRRSFDHLETS
ncbi:hypothetical protein OG782_25730 [Streptomyces sp. NBC_00876]|uniref:hypothetical protein n=1 Tax=Streptomyces sp. NBC_00876 TaxID=2975853 RepID=UPI003867365F|nr:hypothetical protein OG782_25730 [Streptomyces sp. NBC_00876]